MRTVALFGATGKTGQRVLQRAITAGFSVRVLARDPSKFRALLPLPPSVTVIRGDVLDPSAVEETVVGADAVISVFGQVKGSPHDLQTRGTSLIVESMKRRGIRRLITLSGGGLRDEEHDRPKTADHMIRFLLKLLDRQVLADAEAHLKVLRASELDWTVVRGPRLTEHPGQGRYRLGWVGVGTGTQISRDNLADFILTQIDDSRFIGQLPFVSA